MLMGSMKITVKASLTDYQGCCPEAQPITKQAAVPLGCGSAEGGLAWPSLDRFLYDQACNIELSREVPGSALLPASPHGPL